MNSKSPKDAANENFSNARLRAFFKSVYSRLKREDDCLPSLHDVLDITKAKNERYLGIQYIPLDNIIGSEGRYEDFNKSFFPKRDALQSRWSAIDQIMEEQKPLPPISVFKIDNYYFVRDGNHRVSVAKSRNQVDIKAKVTEYEVDVPITKELTIKDRFKIQEHVNFLDATGLSSLGKGFDIKLTRPQSYRLLMNIIQHYGPPFEEEAGKKLSFKEIAEEWYYRIFLPFAEGSYLDDLLAKFPNRTTGDLYVWIQLNWNDVKDSLGKRLSYLAAPLTPEEPVSGYFSELDYQNSGMARGLGSKALRANIGLVVTCVIFNISKSGQISIPIVKRKYHPFEDYWSLPISVINEGETINDSANQCIKNSLGIKKKIDFVHYKTFDGLDRSPYGRMIAFGLLGIHFGDNMHMSAGGLASEINLVKLTENVPLVFDHNKIITEAFEYIHRIHNSFAYMDELIPEDLPQKYTSEFLHQVNNYRHENARLKRKKGLG